jgi:hypothetical protein
MKKYLPELGCFQCFSSPHQFSSGSGSSLDSLLGLCLKQYIESSYLIALQPSIEQLLLIETNLVSWDFPFNSSLTDSTAGAKNNQQHASAIISKTTNLSTPKYCFIISLIWVLFILCRKLGKLFQVGNQSRKFS